jgi:hypothetical protein
VKTTALAALVALAAGSMQAASAAEFGLGVSVQSDDSIIYAPIDINKQFRVEPSIRYQKNEFESGTGLDLETETLELAVGLFGLTGVSESLRIYYGGRLAYIDQESDSLVNSIVGGNIFAARSTQEADGFRISPTLGFEYLINDRFSIGGEAEYFFQDIDGDSGDTESSGTDTRLIVRFKF